MVTFTLPSELRGLFHGPGAKAAYDLLFAAASRALSDKLADPKWLGAKTCGFTAVLHTWNQRLLFHPHLHCIVPGAGLDAAGNYVRVANAHFLVPVAVLRRAFRHRMREGLEALGLGVDPDVWHRDWGVDIRPFGDGENAIKYLGRYVGRGVLADSRLADVDETAGTVTFTWKDRADHDRIKRETLPGTGFVKRYLRHVLPRGMRSIRYYGFCHPAARATRERVAFHSGIALHVGPVEPPAAKAAEPRRCPCCQGPMKHVRKLRPAWTPFTRPPPEPRPAAASP